MVSKGATRMFKSAIALLLLLAGSLGAQPPPVCDPCNCPDPSCYGCHYFCPTFLAANARKAVKPGSKCPPGHQKQRQASTTPVAATAILGGTLLLGMSLRRRKRTR